MEHPMPDTLFPEYAELLEVGCEPGNPVGLIWRMAMDLPIILACVPNAGRKGEMSDFQDGLAEDKRVIAEATEGPWNVVYDFNLSCSDPRGGRRCPITNSGLESLQRKANFAFIAHSRTRFPEAITEIERLQKLFDEQKAEIERWKELAIVHRSVIKEKYLDV
jgi:hypothetical protein